MKGTRTAISVLAAAILAAPLSAGDEDHEQRKCTLEASECITKMVESLSQRGWIGIEWDSKAERPVLTRVVEDSPAEAAGLLEGDLLLAFNGVSTGAGEEAVWTEAKRTLIPGHTITLTVERHGAKKKVNVELVGIPRQVIAQWVGNHVIEHHVIAAETVDKREAEGPRP